MDLDIEQTQELFVTLFAMFWGDNFDDDIECMKYIDFFLSWYLKDFDEHKFELVIKNKNYVAYND